MVNLVDKSSESEYVKSTVFRRILVSDTEPESQVLYFENETQGSGSFRFSWQSNECTLFAQDFANANSSSLDLLRGITHHIQELVIEASTVCDSLAEFVSLLPNLQYLETHCAFQVLAKVPKIKFWCHTIGPEPDPGPGPPQLSSAFVTSYEICNVDTTNSHVLIDFGLVPSVTELTVSNCAPAFAGSSTTLQKLRLRCCDVTKSAIACASLRELSLSNVTVGPRWRDLNWTRLEVVELEDVVGMTLKDVSWGQLTRMKINRCSVENFAQCKLQNLQILDLAQNNLSDATQCFGDYSQLQSLDISSNAFASLAAVNKFKDSLQALIADNNELKQDVDLAGLTQLQTLSLASCKLGNNAKLNLGSPCHLRVLNLSGNTLHNTEIFEILDSLQELSISNVQVASFDFLCNLASLRKLDVSHNALSSLAVAAQLKALTHLDASHNQVRDLEELDGMAFLEDLNVSHNNITSVPETLALPSLQTLDLSGNEIESLGSMGQFPRLCQFVLS